MMRGSAALYGSGGTARAGSGRQAAHGAAQVAAEEDDRQGPPATDDPGAQPADAHTGDSAEARGRLNLETNAGLNLACCRSAGLMTHPAMTTAAGQPARAGAPALANLAGSFRPSRRNPLAGADADSRPVRCVRYSLS